MAVLSTLLAFVGVVALAGFLVSKMDADIATLRAKLAPNAFAGQVVWLTGASSGIGAALAKVLAAHGAYVVLSARREDRLREVLAECKAAGGKGETMLLDLTDYESHAALAKRIVDKHGRIDALVNNAGRGQRCLVEENTGIDVEQKLFETNVFGTISVTKAVVPYMLAAKKGSIMVTSSVAGKVPTPCGAGYSATKHAVNGYFGSLRAETGSRGIKVTVACPGPTESEGQSKSMRADGTLVGAATDNSKRLTAERCANLMAAAMANGIAESWISPQPVLLFTYIAQYLPVAASILGPSVGAKRVAAYRGGSMDYNFVQTWLKSFFTGKGDKAE